MTRADVLRVCLDWGLLPRYPVYMARGGCMGCFCKRKAEVQAMIALAPAVVGRVAAARGSCAGRARRLLPHVPERGRVHRGSARPVVDVRSG